MVGRGNFVVSTTSATDLTATLFQALPGDVNGDKKVDTSDISLILGSLAFEDGQDIWTWSEGDTTGDGFVDTDDIAEILSTLPLS